MCFKNKTCGKNIPKKCKISGFKKVQICLEQLLFKHRMLAENGEHRNRHVRPLAYVSLVFYVRACMSLKKEIFSVLRVIDSGSVRDATSYGLILFFYSQCVRMQQILPALRSVTVSY